MEVIGISSRPKNTWEDLRGTIISTCLRKIFHLAFGNGERHDRVESVIMKTQYVRT